MRHLISILLLTLCPTLCWAQGNDFSFSRQMLEKSREMFEIEEYDSALYYLNRAEMKKDEIEKNLELYAEIQEQYCLVQSAMDNHLQSDYHRNIYLESITKSKRDNDIERDVEEVRQKSEWLSIKITLFSFALMIMLLTFIFYKDKYSVDENTGERILRKKDYDAQEEELDENIALLQHKLRTNKEQNTDKRTKLFLINTVSPLIARLRKAIELQDNEYAQEILTQIAQYNELLTQWIQLEQGKLSFKIDSFSISELLNILERNKKTFSIQGIQLLVGTSEAKVKADKVLTLFMLNTLADNARKATESGGKIEIYAEEVDNYVELSVKDSGKGMSEEQAANIFTHTITNGHGFGLLNCRGIINSYKKVGSYFSCCMIGVESKLGEGSRFFFRLPIVKLLLLLLSFSVPSLAQEPHDSRYNLNIEDSILKQATRLADSAYYSNIDGEYEKTLTYVDSVQICLLQTFSDSTLIDNINLDVSNEAAIASLALHRWEDYRTYNSIFENILTRVSRNDNLDMKNYCEEQTVYLDTMKIVWRAVNILFFVFLAVMLFYLRYLWNKRKKMVEYRENLCLDDKKSMVKLLEYENEALHISNNILTNGLSTIKHETMYYPSRISALLKGNNDKAETAELVNFYEQLYNNLAQQLSDQKISSGVKISKKMLGNGLAIRTDADLYSYLIIQIKKFLGCRQLDVAFRKEGFYTDVIITTAQQLDPDCFSPTSRNIPMLICRQIMRDTSGHNSRGNGIIIEGNKIILRFS